MEWVNKLNEAMDYIEAHIAEEITSEQLAQIACCSPYHFQRMFTYLAGVPLSEYIRRRRMSLAAAELQAGARVIDIALKYGYDSPTAFNRAFQVIHGVAPSHIKDAGVVLRAFPPIRFNISIRGGQEMEYRIESKPAFRIVGLSEPLDAEIEKNFEVVPKLWTRAATEGAIPRLASMMDSSPMGLLGVSACGPQDAWRYYIAVASTQDAAGMDEYTVPAFTWAVFPGEGVCPEAMQDLERRIVTEWLPNSGYEYDDGPDIELYLNPEPQDAKFEVWIPVRKV